CVNPPTEPAGIVEWAEEQLHRYAEWRGAEREAARRREAITEHDARAEREPDEEQRFYDASGIPLGDVHAVRGLAAARPAYEALRDEQLTHEATLRSSAIHSSVAGLDVDAIDAAMTDAEALADQHEALQAEVAGIEADITRAQ